MAAFSLSSSDRMMASGFLSSSFPKVAQVSSVCLPTLSMRSKKYGGEQFNGQALRSSRNCCIFAQYEGRRGSGAGQFIAGFVLGGAVFGALGYFFQPQVTKTLFGAKDAESENSPINIDDDEGIEKTRRNLNEKIAKLNAAIDGVSAQLRADNGFTYSDDTTTAELESAA